MTEGAVAREMAAAGEDAAKTAGLRLYLRHGVTGARGMAEAGSAPAKGLRATSKPSASSTR